MNFKQFEDEDNYYDDDFDNEPDAKDKSKTPSKPKKLR
jgi:hypothetical protein